MRLRDPKTGKVFGTIESAIHAFQCPGPYHDCPMAIKTGGCGACLDGMWWPDHPAEAAQLIGYEVIEDEKEDNMEKKNKPLSEWTLGEVQSYCLGRTTRCDGCEFMGINCSGDPASWEFDGESKEPAKPRLAEVLGVEVGELFGVKGYDEDERPFYVDENGIMRWNKYGSIVIPTVIHDSINHPESIIRAPRLTAAELERCRVYGAKWVTKNRQYIVELWGEKPEMNSYGAFVLQGEDDSIASVQERFFPSVHPGDCICIEEAGGK